MHWFAAVRGDWTDKDYVLSLSLTIYEDGLCACGQPLILAHHEDNDGWYTAHTKQCHSCAARERAAKPTKGSEPVPGMKVHTTYDRPPDRPLRERSEA